MSVNTVNELAPETIDLIKSAIQTELLKRGFHAPISIRGDKHVRVGYRLLVSSETFQTTPVIFKSLQITDFGSSIYKLENLKDDRIQVVIRVSVSYEHFDHGSNATELFTFGCIVPADKVAIWSVTVQ